MTITRLEYAIFKRLRDLDALPLGSRILDVHGSEWHGDVAIKELGQDIYAYAQKERRKELFLELDCIASKTQATLPLDVANVWFEAFFHAKPISLKQLDSNQSTPGHDITTSLTTPFDCVIDLGSAGQFFNTYDYFKCLHDWTTPGGLMIVKAPLSGWLNHEFYHFSPTFFWDLATANDYTTMAFIHAQRNGTTLQQIESREKTMNYFAEQGIPNYSLIYSFAVKETDSDFKVPEPTKPWPGI